MNDAASESFYEITAFGEDGTNRRTVIMISLDHPDWCEFEKTPLCQELFRYLDRLEAGLPPESGA